MTDKERVEHILKLRKKYLGRGVYRGYIQNEVNTRLGFWINLFCKLDLWNADDYIIETYYRQGYVWLEERRLDRKERKRKGYDRACKRYEKMVEDTPPNMCTKEWLKYLNRLDILSGRICSYESNNYPMPRFAIGFLRREFFIKTGRMNQPIK